jgi:hypothetical protein
MERSSLLRLESSLSLSLFPMLFCSIEKGSCVMQKMFYVTQEHTTVMPFSAAPNMGKCQKIFSIEANKA